MSAALGRVSVLVVTHNSAGTLRQTLEPIAGGNVEVIVVDNASTDHSVEIAASYDGVKVVRSPGNLGFGRGSNLAASHATCELLLLLNPDCVAMPDAIATMATRLLENPGLGFVGP